MNITKYIKRRENEKGHIIMNCMKKKGGSQDETFEKYSSGYTFKKYSKKIPLNKYQHINIIILLFRSKNKHYIKNEQE